MSTYQDALKRGHKEGAGRCDDAAAIALFCDTSLQILLGAVSPQLVWEGAQKQGWTFLELGKATAADPAAVEELQWL